MAPRAEITRPLDLAFLMVDKNRLITNAYAAIRRFVRGVRISDTPLDPTPEPLTDASTSGTGNAGFASHGDRVVSSSQAVLEAAEGVGVMAPKGLAFQTQKHPCDIDLGIHLGDLVGCRPSNPLFKGEACDRGRYRYVRVTSWRALSRWTALHRLPSAKAPEQATLLAQRENGR